MRLSFLFPIFVVALCLGGCASGITGQSKEITVRTPGAKNARCLLDNGTVVMPAYTDETVRITKNYKDLKVSCEASGNRRVEKTFDLGFEPWTAANIVNGVVPGVAYDVASGGIYDYPDEISINFTGLKATEYPLPAHHDSDAIRSSDVMLEEFMPSSPRLARDKGRVSKSIEKIDPSERAGYNPFIPNTERAGSQDAPVSLTGE